MRNSPDKVHYDPVNHWLIVYALSKCNCNFINKIRNQ